MKHWVIILMLAMPGSAMAAEVGGVQLVESVSVQGKVLQLNGAGIRTKFFFDIYVGALYRSSPARDATAVLEQPAPSVVTMDFLYKSVDKEKLTRGWSEGFRKNLSHDVLQILESRLTKFNAMFGDSRRGDRYLIEFRTDGSTVVMLNGKLVGSIEGKDFQRALLSVWLGDRPADADLKRAMLGGQ